MSTLDNAVKAKVLRQVEFYFSDSNLPKDKFLKERIAEDPDGYVKIAVIAAFARMRDLLQVSSADPSQMPAEKVADVADILASSPNLQLDESKTKIKRKAPMASEAEIARALDARTIYARPFPVEATVDAITDFFHTHAPVNCVRMRRHVKSKMFKGSVFVEFASVEDAEKVLAMNLEFAGALLRMLKKVEFCDGKRNARKNRGAPGRYDGDMSDDSNVGQGLPDGAGGELDGNAVTSAPTPAGGQPKDAAATKPHQHNQQQQNKRGPKRKQEEELEYDEGDLGDGPSAKRSKPEADGKAAAGNGEEAGADPNGEEEAEGEAVATPSFTPGCVVAFTLETELPELTGPRVIGDVFGGRDKVKFVEMTESRKSGYLRFASPNLATTAVSDFQARAEGERTIAGIKGSMQKAEGDEEVEYYKRADAAAAAKARNRQGHGRGGGRGDFRGGRGGRGRGGRGGFRGGRGGRRGGR